MIPDDYLDSGVLLDALQGGEEGILGPSKDFLSALVEEDDEAKIIPLGRDCRVVAVDLSDDALLGMVEYDPVTHDFFACASFDTQRPAAIPAVTDVLPAVKTWIEGVSEPRTNFYSAREEPEVPPKTPAKKGPATKKITNYAIMEHLTAVQTQLQALQAQHDALKKSQATSSATPVAAASGLMTTTSKLPGVSAGLLAPTGTVSAVAKLMGPPPKSKPPVVLDVAEGGETGGDGGGADPSEITSDPMVKALTQQSQALTALVAHLAGGDPLTELQAIGSGSGGSLSSKGVARRERMQQDLANRQSSYFLQVQQQLFRRMHPSLPVPRTEAELIGYGATMTSYMEKQGGYQNNKDHALCLWIAAHAMDSAMVGDDYGCKEFLALLIACLEQASYDGNWNVAYLLSLLEMPPATVFTARVHNMPGLERPFSPLVPQQWAALHERSRCPHHQEDRTQSPEVRCTEEPDTKADRRRCSRDAKSKTKTKVPKEAERVTRPKSFLAASGRIVSQGGPSMTSPLVHDDAVGGGFCEGRDAVLLAASTLRPVELDSKPPKVEGPGNNPRDHKHEPVSHKMHSLSYARWCSTLVPEVLRTRTPFGAFLARTIQLSRCLSSDTAPTFFPLPIPPGYWHEMPAGLSADRRRSIHRSRALHVITMGPNFWHSGGTFPDDHLLQRAPNRLHLTLYKRVRALLRSDGPASAFEITKAGRRFPELVSRLGELSEVLTKNGCTASPYEKSFSGASIS